MERKLNIKQEKMKKLSTWFKPNLKAITQTAELQSLAFLPNKVGLICLVVVHLGRCGSSIDVSFVISWPGRFESSIHQSKLKNFLSSFRVSKLEINLKWRRNIHGTCINKQSIATSSPLIILRFMQSIQNCVIGYKQKNLWAHFIT